MIQKFRLYAHTCMVREYIVKQFVRTKICKKVCAVGFVFSRAILLKNILLIQSAYLCVWPLSACCVCTGNMAFKHLRFVCMCMFKTANKKLKNFIRSFQNATSSFYVICFFMDTWTCRFQLNLMSMALYTVHNSSHTNVPFHFRNTPTSQGDNIITATKDAYFSNTLLIMEGVLHSTMYSGCMPGHRGVTSELDPQRGWLSGARPHFHFISFSFLSFTVHKTK